MKKTMGRRTNYEQDPPQKFAKHIDQLEELKGSLEDLQAEEEEYRDNIPENMQESERI